MDTAIYVNVIGKNINNNLKCCVNLNYNWLLNIILIHHLDKLICDLNPFNVTMDESDRIKIKGFIDNMKKELPVYYI